MMIAMKKTKSHVQALPGMAKDEAKVADVVHLLGTSRSGGPSPRAPLPPKSLDDDDKERSGGSSLDDEFLSYLSGSGNITPRSPLPLLRWRWYPHPHGQNPTERQSKRV
jgi:hypothetical protein